MNSAPWTFQLDTRELANGPHEVSVEAYDSHAMIASSKAITIYTSNQTSTEQVPPVVVAKQQPSTPKATAAAPAPKTRATKPAVKVQTAARTPKAQVVAPVAKTQATVPTPKVQAVAPVAKAQTTVTTPKAQAAAPAAKVQATVPTPKAQAMAPAAEVKTAVPTPKVQAVVPAAEVQTPVPAPTVQAAAPAAVEAPTSTAALGTTVKPTAIAAAETIATGASAAPIVTMRGPAPEPTRTASLETPAARSTDLAKAETSTASVATPSLLTPPKVKLAQSSLPHPTPIVMLDGKPLSGGVAPRLTKGRMHSGFRALFAATGARVEWLPGERTARAVLGSVTVDVPVGSRVATVNGREVDMGGIATIKDGRTVVPLRFFAQATGSSISWNAQTGVASVQTPTHALASVPASIPSTASMPGPDTDSSGMRTLIFETSDRAP
jgi:hypothetical protein